MLEIEVTLDRINHLYEDFEKKYEGRFDLVEKKKET